MMILSIRSNKKASNAFGSAISAPTAQLNTFIACGIIKA